MEVAGGVNEISCAHAMHDQHIRFSIFTKRKRLLTTYMYFNMSSRSTALCLCRRRSLRKR